jgi:hypothetical protein
MKQATIEVVERPAARFYIEERPHELSRAMLETQFSLVFRVRHPLRPRRRDRLCDFMAVDSDLRTWWVAAVEPSERLSVLLRLMTDRKLARQVAGGDGVQMHCWTRWVGAALQVEIVELVADDFTCGR